MKKFNIIILIIISCFYSLKAEDINYDNFDPEKIYFSDNNEIFNTRRIINRFLNQQNDTIPPKIISEEIQYNRTILIIEDQDNYGNKDSTEVTKVLKLNSSKNIDFEVKYVFLENSKKAIVTISIIDNNISGYARIYGYDKNNNYFSYGFYLENHIIKFTEEKLKYDLKSDISGIISQDIILKNFNYNYLFMDKIEVITKNQYENIQSPFSIDGKSIDSIFKPKKEFLFKVLFDTEIGLGNYQDSIGIIIHYKNQEPIVLFFTEFEVIYGDGVISVEDVYFEPTIVDGRISTSNIVINNIGGKELRITKYKSKNQIGKISNELIFYTNIQLNNQSNSIILSPGKQVKINFMFKPDEPIDYLDTLVFISDSDTSFQCHDNLCILRGKGIKNKLFSIDHSWNNVQVNHVKYDSYPFRDNVIHPADNEAITITNKSDKKIEITDVEIVKKNNSNAFKFQYNNEKLYSIDNESILIAMFKGKELDINESMTIPIYFDPKVEGIHELSFNLTSNEDNTAKIILSGTAITPRLSINDFKVHSESIYYDDSIVLIDTLVIECLEGEFYTEARIDDIKPVIEGEISNDGETYGSKGFMFDKTELELPLILQPSEKLKIPIYFKPHHRGKFSADLALITNAIEDTIVTLQGELLVSIDEQNNKFSIKPNPASDKITIAYENGIENIKIMDLNGQVVFESKYNYLSNVLIDLSNITVGVYFIELNEDKELIQKIMIE